MDTNTQRPLTLLCVNDRPQDGANCMINPLPPPAPVNTSKLSPAVPCGGSQYCDSQVRRHMERTKGRAGQRDLGRVGGGSACGAWPTGGRSPCPSPTRAHASPAPSTNITRRHLTANQAYREVVEMHLDLDGNLPDLPDLPANNTIRHNPDPDPRVLAPPYDGCGAIYMSGRVPSEVRVCGFVCALSILLRARTHTHPRLIPATACMFPRHVLTHHNAIPATHFFPRRRVWTTRWGCTLGWTSATIPVPTGTSFTPVVTTMATQSTTIRGNRPGFKSPALFPPCPLPVCTRAKMDASNAKSYTPTLTGHAMGQFR